MGDYMKNGKIMSIILLSSILFIPPSVLFGIVDTAWVRTFNSNGGCDDEAWTIVSDRSGNIYVAGETNGYGASEDFLTIKYSPDGIRQWSARYNGPADSIDYVTCLAVDSLCNIYVAGWSIGLNDDYDFAVVKYDSNGVQQMVIRYNGPANGNDGIADIAVDNLGDIYVTGPSWDNVSQNDYVTIKYDSVGNQLWLQRYNGPENQDDVPSALIIDNIGNAYVTGYGKDSVGDIGYLTIKYNVDGIQQWIARYNNGPYYYEDEASAMAIDNVCNVYVTGYSVGLSTDRDYATVKYNSNGIQQWVRRYNGPGNDWDEASAITVSNTGYIYVTGYSFNADNNEDIATIKYNTNGVQQWVARYNDPNDYDDYAYAIEIDGDENVYITGASNTWFYSHSTTIKYNIVGMQEWVENYSGSGNLDDFTFGIVVDNQGNVYVAGWTYNLSTNYDAVIIKYTQSSSVEENQLPIFVNRYPFEIYPNPARNYFIARFPLKTQYYSLKLYDITGKMIKEERIKIQEERISLEGIRPGVYFLQLNNEPGIKKLVVTK
jgi:uncharacterized delta-60 repeat protein